jgi:hypothetical protein
MPTTRVKLEIAAAVLVLAGAAFGHSVWLQEHDDKVKAQADIAAAKKAFDQLAADRHDHEQADKARDDATAKQLEAMQKLAAQVQTPAQIAAWIPKQLPGVPQPITINVPAATAQNPHPDAIASIPQADLPALRDSIEKCREDSVRLSACQGNLSSRVAEIKMADGQIEQLKKENGDLQTELKGGTFWQRTKRIAKVGACAAAGGAGGSFAGKEKGAAIGAIAGAVACSVF